MAPKRKAPETPETTGSARRSTRISSSGKKSRYFEDESVDELSQEDYPAKRRTGKVVKTKAVAKSSAKSTPNKRKKVESEDEDDDIYNDDDEESTPEGAADEEGNDDSFDEDAPPKVTYIPLPKLRDTGGIPYEDDRLHKNTMLFLKDLKANNKRVWLKCTSPPPFPIHIPRIYGANYHQPTTKSSAAPCATSTPTSPPSPRT